jgi:preprotein translocase subunit YajC
LQGSQPSLRTGNITMGFFINDAYAQAATGGGENPLLGILPLVVLFVVFYFLLIRPQQKRQKEHQEVVSKLAVGDEVVTAGGVLGKITEVSDAYLRVEIADGVKILVQRQTISAAVPKGTMKNI